VNETGCALDSDQDGIDDDRDRCLDSKPLEPVDATGCKIPEVIVLEGVEFEAGSDRLLPSSISTLDAVSKMLLKVPNWFIEVAGYTDNVGNPKANKVLSKKRADAVALYLVLKGFPSSKIVISGHGAEHPIATNNTPKGQARNRRVELHILRR
jgi:outer membrane protein OmpA-like peptidoglycan-associated protein